MPEVADSTALSGVTRKERFRQYFRAFNPTASPLQALENGFIISDLRPELVHKKIAVRVELEPGSRQAIVGGIGSGKTTELLLVQKHLKEQGIFAPYLEGSNFADISTIKPGFLVGLVAGQLFGGLGSPESLRREARAVSQHVWGTWRHKSQLQDEVSPPIEPESLLNDAATSALDKIHRAFRESKQYALLIDGLDRTRDIDRFAEMILPDLAVLRRLEIPVVCVAPLGLQFTPHSDLREQFDRIHELSSIRWTDGGLTRVLKLRDTQSLLTARSADEISTGSGGLLRDLITLARDAGEAAYVSGSEMIEIEHANTAVTQLGQSYSRGLSPSQLQLLRKTNKSGGFDPTDPEMMLLLGTRRVVEYSSTSFSLHPSLAQVLNLNAF